MSTRDWIIAGLVGLLLFSFSFMYYQNNKIDSLNVVINTQKNMEKVEKDSRIIDSNNEKLKLLLKDKVEASKKIEHLENQLLKLKATKPKKESTYNEVKDYSVNDVSSYFSSIGYHNQVLRRDGNLFQLQYSSETRR